MKDLNSVEFSAIRGTQMEIGPVTSLDNRVNEPVQVFRLVTRRLNILAAGREETLLLLPPENKDGWKFYIVPRKFKLKHPKRGDLVCLMDGGFQFGKEFIKLSLFPSV